MGEPPFGKTTKIKADMLFEVALTCWLPAADTVDM